MNSPVHAPYSKPELARDFAAVASWSERFWSEFPSEEFFAPLGEAWSPADNVRHLLKSNRPVAKARRLPKPLLLALFGMALRPSRGYAQLVGSYQEALGNGLTAGRFSARPLEEVEKRPDVQARAVRDLSASLDAVAAATAQWSDTALDRMRLPHPGLGKLTVREMVMFTLYHNVHHVLGAAHRIGR